MLPGYGFNGQNALLDFSPLNQGFDTYRKGMVANQDYKTAQSVAGEVEKKNYSGAMSNALMGDRADLAGVAMQARTADTQDQLHKYTLQRAKIDGVGRMAQAAISETDPAKREAMRQHILSQHPDKDLIQRFPIYGTDQGLTLLAAESGHALNKLDEDFKRSQIELNRAKAGATNALANVRDGRAAPEAPDPMKGWGLDEENKFVPPRGPSINPAVPIARPSSPNALYGTTQAPDELPSDIAPQMAPSGEGRFSPRSNPYGQVGRSAETVPGVVVDAKGKPNPYASTKLAGQDAIDAQDDPNQQRLRKHMQDQQMWTALNGKAPSGFVYNPDGSLRDLKDEAKKSVGREKIGALIEDVQTANQVLQKTNVAERGLGHATGGWISPAAEQAARSVEHAVQFMTAEVEGKRHANAQDVRMLRFFAPAWSDSAEMIGFKLDQLNRIMQGYFGAKTPSGDLFKSQLAKANEAYHQAIKDGKIAPPNVTTKPSLLEGAGGGVKSGKYRFDPATGNMVPL